MSDESPRRFQRVAAVALREDDFGGIGYVPRRDKFFALDRSTFSFLKGIGSGWVDVTPETRPAVIQLAQLGLVRTEPETAMIGVLRPHFVGEFEEIPSVSVPLVLNAFATAHCPLQCVYCHADDLMKPYRETESPDSIDRVLSTIRLIPSVVVVVTGGDPLSAPDRTRRLLQGIPQDRRIVLDTSGVGEIERIEDLLVERNVHVRVSLDAVSDSNSRSRPTNRKYSRDPDASKAGAERTLMRCIELGLAVTVQSVISRTNANEDEWRFLRQWLSSQAIRNWVIHIAVHGGKGRNGRAVPAYEVRARLARFIRQAGSDDPLLDIRCTDTDSTPNSILLVNSEGDLFTEGYAKPGKVALYRSGTGRPDLIRALWPSLDRFGHARRYLNWNPWMWAQTPLSRLAFVGVPAQASSARPFADVAVETEVKFRVLDEEGCMALLLETGWEQSGSEVTESDTYFDSPSRSLSQTDYVIRVRSLGGEGARLALKGPRIFLGDGTHSRVEVEVPVPDDGTVPNSLCQQGYLAASAVSKNRRYFRNATRSGSVVVDVVEGLGRFLEIEGDLDLIRDMSVELFAFVEGPISESYGELLSAARNASANSQQETQ